VRALNRDDLVLCSGTLGRIPLEEKARAAAAAGFRGVSVYVHEYRALLEAGGTGAELRAVLDSLELAVAEVDGPMRWLPGHGDERVGRRALYGIDHFVAAAAALGARSVTVLEPWGVAVRDEPGLDAAAEAFARVCDRFASINVIAHIEFYPWSGIADLRTAVDIVRLADRPNGGVLIDTWHLRRGPDAGVLPDDVGGDVVRGLQINDTQAEPAASVMQECMHDRLLPGKGSASVREVVAALRGRGCDAPVGVEVFSDELLALGPAVAARRCFDAARSVLAPNW
jgi:sugar phosphate isomerase/epimerase